jgi:hypothetical protein
MLYLVEAHLTIEVGDRVDAGEGPGPMIAKITERFRPRRSTAIRRDGKAS